MSLPWQPARSFSPITWRPRDPQETQQLPYHPNYPTDQTHLTNSLNPAPVPKSLIPSPGHKTRLPLILDPFYTSSSSLLSHPRTFLDPLSPTRRVVGDIRPKFSSIFDSQFLPRAQLNLPLHWLLKASATRWGSDGIPTKLGIAII